MAKVDAATFKAQMATVATALTAAYKDDTLNGVAEELSNPHHPLRDYVRCLKLNTTTGVFTSDDAHIDAIYAGRFPSKSIRNQESVTDKPVP